MKARCFNVLSPLYTNEITDKFNFEVIKKTTTQKHIDDNTERVDQSQLTEHGLL